MMITNYFKYHKGLIILILLIFSVSHIYAQEISEYKWLYGKVITGENNEPLPGVHITIKNKNTGIVSDIDGNFSVKIKRHDTLSFSFVGYKDHQLLVNDSLFALANNFIVKMETSAIELNPVSVFAYKTERDFKKAVIDHKLSEEKELDIYIPGNFEGKPKQPKTGIGSPISLLTNKFGKKARMSRKFEDAKRREEYRKFINAKYNKDIVAKITGLEKEVLQKFMTFCSLPDQFVEKASEYDLIVAINKCYGDFKEKK